LSKIKVRSKPTDWFNDQEFNKLIDATYLFDNRNKRSAELSPNATRLRTMLLLMRYSGLSIGNAATLERERLDNDDNLFLYRAILIAGLTHLISLGKHSHRRSDLCRTPASGGSPLAAVFELPAVAPLLATTQANYGFFGRRKGYL
jgi:integrase